MKTQLTINNKIKNQGFSLIELLVAVVILAVGLLGMLSLQTASFFMNKSNLYRTQALILTQDMAERIRTSVDLANTEILKRAQRAAYELAPPAADPECIHTDAGCSLANLAATDLWQWTQAVAITLPGGAGIIARDASGAFTITVSWNDPNWSRQANDRAKNLNLVLDLGS